MKKLLIFLIFFSVIIFAQDENLWDEIRNSGNYYYGEAKNEILDAAEDEAISKLLNKISSNIVSKFQRQINEKNGKIEETVSKIVKTYSTARLDNLKEKIKKNNDGTFTVLKYIGKIKVNEIFEKRKKSVEGLYSTANVEMEELNLSEALKHLYYAIILMNSIPETNIMVGKDNLRISVPNKINSILRNINFRVKNDKKISSTERRIILYADYNNSPIQSLDFEFWDGKQLINANIKDGEYILSLLGPSVNIEKINLKIDYQHYKSRYEIPEVGTLWDLVKRPKFENVFNLNLQKNKSVTRRPDYRKKEIDVNQNSNAYYSKNRTETNNEAGKKEIVANKSKSIYNIKLTFSDSCKVKKEILLSTRKLLEYIDSYNPYSVTTLDADEFFSEKINRILRYNNLKIAENTIVAKINKTEQGWELRKINAICYYPTLRKKTYEFLVVDFDKAGKLYDINFGITKKLYNRFVEEGAWAGDWGNRQVIVKFIEKYRTIFMSRDMKTLDDIFADEALIIIGRVIKRKKFNTDLVKYVKLNDAQPDFEQIKLTKREYLARQKKIFLERPDLFLSFSDFSISKKNRSNSSIYGVSLRQSYLSTTYSDEGYLFLLINFSKKEPKIYVRSWQPHEWDEESLMELSNFSVIK